MVLIISAVFMASCTAGGRGPFDETTEESGLKVYLLNSSNDALMAVDIDATETDISAQLEDILRNLYEGNGDAGYKGTIPQKDMVEGYEILENSIRLHMIPSFEDLDDVSMLICRSSIIKSVTSIDGVDFIEFYVDGLPLKNDNGKVYGAFYPADIITASKVINEDLITRTVLLYYPDDEGMGLIQVKMTIDMAASDAVERVLIENLMTVPDGLNVISPIPQGTQIKNVHTKDGICYVDFSDSFRINHYGGSAGEMLTVYSVVNTLTELPDISRVQFLIEGDKTDFFKGHLDFSQLFEYNIELINKK